MTESIFITGTDTDAGKTFVTCQLIDYLVRQNKKVAAIKPIASGAEWIDGQLKNDDALKLQAHANADLEYNQINPFCFQPAIAPHIAAKKNNQTVTLSAVQQHYQQLPTGFDVILTEGAGGWLVPINSNEFFSDLAVSLNAKVILVVGMKLGCINHALLTEMAIKNTGLECIGWVANRVDPNMQCYQENLETLKQQMQSPLIAEVAFNAEQTEFNI